MKNLSCHTLYKKLTNPVRKMMMKTTYVLPVGSSVSKQKAVKSEINKPKSQLSITAGSIKTKRKR